VRGKIILFTHNDFIYKENDKKMQIGLRVSVPGMGDCDKEKWLDKPSVSVPNDGMIEIKKDADKYEICYPRTTNHTFSISSSLMSDYKILVQDDYNLLKKEKWAVINDLLNNDIPIATEIRNDTDYYLDIYGKDNKFTTKFYNDDDVLTINFMNIQAVWKIGRTIKGFAEYINNNLLSNILNKNLHMHNKWMVMDFPSTEIIRKIRDSTDYELNKRSNLPDNIIQVDNYLIYTDLSYYIQTLPSKDDTEDDETLACLQRKRINNNQGESQELIKTDYKCVNNKFNKWFIKQKGNYYSIISSYDAKCLNYSEDKIYMDYCKDNNKYELFTIKNGKICAQYNNSKCLSNEFKIIPTIIESPRYEDISCSSIFADLGFSCCYNKDTQTEYIDEIGNWGIEDDKLCGIGYERCSWNAIGYPCCSSVNPKVVYSDGNGDWGFEDDQWCGIGEVNINRRIRIKNKKTQECLITNLYSDNTIILLGDCNHSEWT